MTQTTGNPVRIATRASRLALWQAHHVADLLRQTFSGIEIELFQITTQGDQDQKMPLASLGGTGVFTREIQRAVLEGQAEIAVHSLKDLPTEPVDGLVLAAVPERGPISDALVLPKATESAAAMVSTAAEDADLFDRLPEGARIGTGSLRRRAQLLHHRSDLQMKESRGNVETRLRKLDGGDYDALVLAEAGLCRLGLQHRLSAFLRPPLMYPAVGQGALGIECATDNENVRSLLEAISSSQTLAAVVAERSLLAALRAGCHAPVGTLSTVRDDQLTLESVVLSPDGEKRLFASKTRAIGEATELGREVADELLVQGAETLIADAESPG